MSCYFTSFFKIALYMHCQSGKDSSENKFHKNWSRVVLALNYFISVCFFTKQGCMQVLYIGEKNIFIFQCSREYLKIELPQLIVDFKYLLPDRIFLLTGFHLLSPLHSKGSTMFQRERNIIQKMSVMDECNQLQHACRKFCRRMLLVEHFFGESSLDWT